MDLVRRWLPKKKPAIQAEPEDGNSELSTGAYLLRLKSRIETDLALLRSERGFAGQALLEGLQVLTGRFSETRPFLAKKATPEPEYLYLEFRGRPGLLLEAEAANPNRLCAYVATRVIPEARPAELPSRNQPSQQVMFVTQSGPVEMIERKEGDLARTIEGRTLSIEQASELLLVLGMDAAEGAQ